METTNPARDFLGVLQTAGDDSVICKALEELAVMSKEKRGADLILGVEGLPGAIRDRLKQAFEKDTQEPPKEEAQDDPGLSLNSIVQLWNNLHARDPIKMPAVDPNDATVLLNTFVT